MAHANPTKPILIHFTPSEAGMIENMQTNLKTIEGRTITRTKIVRAALILAAQMPVEKIMATIDTINGEVAI